MIKIEHYILWPSYFKPASWIENIECLVCDVTVNQPIWVISVHAGM